MFPRRRHISPIYFIYSHQLSTELPFTSSLHYCSTPMRTRVESLHDASKSKMAARLLKHSMMTFSHDIFGRWTIRKFTTLLPSCLRWALTSTAISMLTLTSARLQLSGVPSANLAAHASVCAIDAEARFCAYTHFQKKPSGYQSLLIALAVWRRYVVYIARCLMHGDTLHETSMPT